MAGHITRERRIARNLLATFEDPQKTSINRVTVGTHSPAALLEQYAAIVDELIDAGITPADRREQIMVWGEGQVTHEEQHAAAAMKIGGLITYRLALFRPKYDPSPAVGLEIKWRQPAHTTTLDIAAVVAHPTDISIGDLADLLKLGFTPTTVADAIVEHNNYHPDDQSLPMPLSYKE